MTRVSFSAFALVLVSGLVGLHSASIAAAMAGVASATAPDAGLPVASRIAFVISSRVGIGGPFDLCAAF